MPAMFFNAFNSNIGFESAEFRVQSAECGVRSAECRVQSVSVGQKLRVMVTGQ